MKVLVVGDAGLLGQAFVRMCLKSRHEVQGFSTSPVTVPATCDSQYTHHIIDLRTDWARVEQLIDAFRPDLLLNAAAYASIPFCEDHPTQATFLNVDIPRKLAIVSRRGIYYVHISSDQIFDGTSFVPYREEDPPRPLNAYGHMKLASELAVLEENPDALVVRTNIVGLKGRPYSQSFAEWLVHSLKTRSPITLYTNYVTSSIHVDLLSEVVFDCFEERLSGLFHIASSDYASKYDFGRKLAERLEVDFSCVTKAVMAPGTMVPPRPEFLALATGSIERCLGRSMPTVEQTLSLLVNQAKEAERVA